LKEEAMRVSFAGLVSGGLLLAGLAAVPALSTPQAAQPPAPAESAAPPAMPSHEATPPAAAPAAPGDLPLAHPNTLRKLIAGRENEPAEKVFKNVQVLKGLPAGHFLDAMEGFSHALGTNCKKCHDTENFASDDKEEKKTARGMVTMTRDINEKYIKTMPGLDQEAHVGCFTCHHGQSNPNARPKTPPAEHPGPPPHPPAEHPGA
jgi:hypothetical protein